VSTAVEDFACEILARSAEYSAAVAAAPVAALIAATIAKVVFDISGFLLFFEIETTMRKGAVYTRQILVKNFA
jgi:hypothetical protein